MEKRILIADDESIIRMNLRESLTELGYLVVGEAGDGLSAINLTRQLRPDLVILDVKMPRMTGLEAAQVIGKEDLAPVLLITAYCDREQVMQAREAGVLGYLVKPIRDAELLPTIEVTRARWQERHQRKQELSQLRERLETRKVIERAKGYLMDQQGLKEADAFRKIQQLAMNSRKTMKEVAQAILLTQHLSS
ncbi:MAG: response regulator [Chloroflexaceae bacterium]|jgi:response regulator NasT|nr:response regulator [Chloroflexaceae bacterium]